MSKTSEERIRLYLSKLKKYKNSVIKAKKLSEITSSSDISDKDTENLDLRFEESYRRASRLIDLGNINEAILELENTYLYSFHSKSTFMSFFNLYKDFSSETDNGEIKKRFLKISSQALEFGINESVDLKVYETRKLISRGLILFFSLVLILIISFFTYKAFLSIISKKYEKPLEIQKQKLPSLTRTTKLPVQTADFALNSSVPYYVEVEEGKVIVFDESYAYHVKAGIISKNNSLKKLSYSITVYDDLEKSIFMRVFEKEADTPLKWGKNVYVPIDINYSINKPLSGHPKKINLDILSVEFFIDEQNIYSGVLLSTNSTFLEFRYIGNNFKERFGIYEANTIIEVYNMSKNNIKGLEFEIGYLDVEGVEFRNLKRKVISDSTSFLKSGSRQTFEIKTIFPKELYPNITNDFNSIKIRSVLIK